MKKWSPDSSCSGCVDWEDLACSSCHATTMARIIVYSSSMLTPNVNLNSPSHNEQCHKHHSQNDQEEPARK
eukprot:3727836-Amphidinium_carterae.1